MFSYFLLDLFGGFVPVAPVGTGRFSSAFPSIRVPTMIVYGEKDTGLGTESLANLMNIPTATQPQGPVKMSCCYY